ncbi:MAG: lysine 2,3-aminomutase, partial [Nitrospinota bacterium]|nr:lysine 2,3-aminomutase [Nitrospinota bacterium]
IDAPGGGGKVRLLPDTVVEHNDREIVIKNYEGKIYRYPQPSNPSQVKKNKMLASEEERSVSSDICRLSA